MIIGPITGATISTLVCYLRRALATASAGQALEIRLDLSCCTNLTIEGALGLDSARREVQKRGGTLSLTRVPPLIEHVLHQHNRLCCVRDRVTWLSDRPAGRQMASASSLNAAGSRWCAGASVALS